MSDNNNSSNDINSWFSRPLLIAIAIAFVFGCGGIEFALTRIVDTNLKAALINASIVLFFGALLGGIVKLLIDDHQKLQDQRANQAQFLTNVLDDLKAVYDRVERARILIPAHKSAKTYGAEMRDLIEARVDLRNVIRALDRVSNGLHEEQRKNLQLAVVTMEKYLEKLTDDFKKYYREASAKQKIFETRVERIVKDKDKVASSIEGINNEAWKVILDMPETKGFIGEQPTDESDPTSESKDLEYTKRFERPLGLGTWILRNELQVTLGRAREPMPERHTKTLKKLKKFSEHASESA
jgi:hypothetical protein